MQCRDQSEATTGFRQFLCAVMSLCLILSAALTLFQTESLTTSPLHYCHSDTRTTNASWLQLGLKDLPCDVVQELILNSTHPWKINALRRRLALSNVQCLDEHFSLFRQAFLEHLPNKHINLHIPKAGGTSLCRLVQKNSNKTVPESNCFTASFCPYWVGCECPESTPCDKLPHHDFVMNENYLDHPMCDNRAYSIVVREPVARTIPQLDVYLQRLANRKTFNHTEAWRLNVIQSNYMTWSLLAGKYLNESSPEAFHPIFEKHLVEAMEVLETFDFILDLPANTRECTGITLEWMGLDGDKLIQYNSHHGIEMPSYRRENYELLNRIDIELYQYAQELMQVDCAFFMKLKQEHVNRNTN